jgi:hypothetical protein
VSGSSVEAIEEAICVRRCAPGESEIGRGEDWHRVCGEDVAKRADLFSRGVSRMATVLRAGAGVSILWG